jgi:hypothetical protein
MTKKPTPPKKPPRRWRIIYVQKKGRPLGTVEADDAASAIQAGAKLFGVDPARLIAQPVE